MTTKTAAWFDRIRAQKENNHWIAWPINVMSAHGIVKYATIIFGSIERGKPVRCLVWLP